MDGAGPLTIFFRIMLPLMRPGDRGLRDLPVPLGLERPARRPGVRGQPEVAPLTVRVAAMAGSDGRNGSCCSAGAFISMVGAAAGVLRLPALLRARSARRVGQGVDMSELANALPQDFTVGVGTSSWQVEGASASRGRTIWDDFADVPGAIVDGTTADPACEHVARMQQDVDLLAWLGVDAYRFSVAWARVQPGAAGRCRRPGWTTTTGYATRCWPRGSPRWSRCTTGICPVSCRPRAAGSTRGRASCSGSTPTPWPPAWGIVSEPGRP